MNVFQILAICGMLSPIAYTIMWILGGIMQPEYNHIQDDISSLFAVNAPNKRLMQSIIITSSVLLFIFYIGLHEGINNGEGSIMGPILFLTSSVLGILVALFFPLDAGGKIITLRGTMIYVLTCPQDTMLFPLRFSIYHQHGEHSLVEIVFNLEIAVTPTIHTHNILPPVCA